MLKVHTPYSSEKHDTLTSLFDRPPGDLTLLSWLSGLESCVSGLSAVVGRAAGATVTAGVLCFLFSCGEAALLTVAGAPGVSVFVTAGVTVLSAAGGTVFSVADCGG